MRRATLVGVLLLMVPGLLAVPAAAQEALPQPAGDIAGVELVGNVPEAKQATAINFLEYGRAGRQRTVMVVNGRFGLKTYDLADPAAPVLLDELTSEELKLPGDVEGTFWQNEDMDVDQRRKLVFMARDPRAYGRAATDPTAVSGVYLVDARDPADLRIITFHAVPAGHTSTCINDCDFLWTGGPASNTDQLEAYPGGRPIWVTDIRNPRNPRTYPTPIDLGRDDGVNAYAHDVQVDEAGIAWVSGRGGVRGYHTRGFHRDPLQDRIRRATAANPVPYAGGGFEAQAAPTEFMHNSIRPVTGSGRWDRPGAAPTDDWDRRWGGRRQPQGDLIYATEEAFVSPTCDGTTGLFSIASLEGSYDGEGWRSTPEDPFRLRTVSTWSPYQQEGTSPTAFCSAHYFELRDGVIAYAWYGQGTRFLDVSDPANPIQIAYYRPDDTNVWAPYYYGDYVYTADYGRGVDILRLTDEARANADTRTDLVAPAMSAAALARITETARDFAPDPDLGWACVLPRQDT